MPNPTPGREHPFTLVTWPGAEAGPGLHPVTITDSQRDAMVAAAVATGRIPPWKRDHWRDRLAAGGREGGQAIMTLLGMYQAPPDVVAAWRRDPRARPAQAATASRAPANPDDALYPTDEAAAAEAERRTRRQAREAVRFRDGQNYANMLTAAAQAADTGPGHKPVPGHGPATVEHEHEHSDYAGGQHTHPHVHRADNLHEPGAGHGHGAAASDTVAAGIDARRAARLRTDPGDPAAGSSDDQLFDQLFGPPGQ